MLVLVTREATGGWYNVVDAQSGEDGWVRGDLIALKLTSQTATTPFQTREAASGASPTVEAVNDTDRILTFTIGSQKHQIQPGATLTIPVTTGTQRYIASVPGVLPFAGTENFETGRVYAWRFYIKRG